MKALTVVLTLTLSACAHETTTMDRELALKLADRPQVIVTPPSAPAIVNVNVGSQPAPQAVAAHGPWERYQRQAPVDDNSYDGTMPEGPVTGDTRKNCMNSPVYTSGGAFSHLVKQCFGTK